MSQTLLNNRYKIVSSLARGGFGETFLAVDTHLPSGKKCVIKQLKPPQEVVQSAQWLKERFEKEAIILEELGNNCSQIPKLYAYFSEEGNFYLVQEWIEGMTLAELHHKGGNFSESEVEELLIDILPVLDYIHSQQIIHRDIKPDNIIIRKSDGKPVLIDFGIIKEKVTTQIRSNKKSSIILGTPGYMPSEQAAGRPVYSSDLYSLGLTAVFMLTGQNAEDFAVDHNTGELLWRNALKNSHSQLITILEQVIRFHPRDRFSSAGEMLAALKRVPSQSVTRVLSKTRVITPATSNKKQENYQQKPRKTGLGFLSWLAIFAVSFGGFILGFNLIRWQSVINKSEKKTIPSTVNSPSISITPEPESTPRQSRRKKRRRSIESSPKPTPQPTESIDLSPKPKPIPTSEPSLKPEVRLQTPTPSYTPTPEASRKSEPSTTHVIPVEPPGTQIIPVEPPPPERIPEPSQQ
jgi:serine/threonine protein kinase, bacterial